MKTLDILDAADFLKMHPEVLRRKAHNGTIPGRKPVSVGYLLRSILLTG